MKGISHNKGGIFSARINIPYQDIYQSTHLL